MSSPGSRSVLLPIQTSPKRCGDRMRRSHAGLVDASVLSREDRGLSQRDLAELVGMTPPQLSKIEGGYSDLRVSTVQTLLRAVGASFADIAGPDALEFSQKSLRSRAQRRASRASSSIDSSRARLDDSFLSCYREHLAGTKIHWISNSHLDLNSWAFPLPSRPRSRLTRHRLRPWFIRCRMLKGCCFKHDSIRVSDASGSEQGSKCGD